MSAGNGQTGIPRRAGRDVAPLKRMLLCLGLLLQLLMMAAGLWPAAWLVLHFAPAATAPGHWVLIILGAALVFNYAYLLALLVLRAILPRPKEGLYVLRPDRRIPRQVILFLINLLLVKARFEPPWALTFIPVLANTFPLRFAFTRLFGPRSRSVVLGGFVFVLDPHLVEIGRNVQFGFQCTVTAHVLDNRGLFIRRVKIGDDAVIGGESTIMAGTEIGHHAVVGTRSLVTPNTRIGPYEFWAGVPARKVKDLSPDEEPAAGPAGERSPGPPHPSPADPDRADPTDRANPR